MPGDALIDLDCSMFHIASISGIDYLQRPIRWPSPKLEPMAFDR